MNQVPNDHELSCEDGYRAIHQRADGLLSMDGGQVLDAHLSACASCRGYAEELDALRSALSSLPEVPFPDDALEGVWDRTIRVEREQARSIRRWWRPVAKGLAAAAVIVMTFFGSRAFFVPMEPTLSDQELARLSAETRLVFELTTNALRRVERATMEGLMVEQLSPALRRIPINWNRTKRSESRRTGT